MATVAAEQALAAPAPQSPATSAAVDAGVVRTKLGFTQPVAGSKRNDAFAAHYQPFLPKMYLPSSTATCNPAAKTQPAGTMAITEIEKLRNLLYEKELEVNKLRGENTMLKQIERRQQKEIDQLENQHDDAPRVIRGLREEISGLKLKLKESCSQKVIDDRTIRSQAEQIRVQKEKVARLNELMEAKNLEERNVLQAKLEEHIEKNHVKEKALQDMKRNIELIEKNALAETRQLRGKIQSMEKENQFFKEKCQQQDTVLRDKDKLIASLSIYRFSLVHRKPNDGICKICRRKKREEDENKRREYILSMVPILSAPQLSVLSPTSAEIKFALPDSGPVLDQDAINMHLNPVSGDFDQSLPAGTTTSGIQAEVELEAAVGADARQDRGKDEKVTAPPSSPPKEISTETTEGDGAKAADSGAAVTASATLSDGSSLQSTSPQDVWRYTHVKVIYRAIDDTEHRAVVIPYEKAKADGAVVLDGLSTGKLYTVQIAASNGDLEQVASKPESILIDILPPELAAPTVVQASAENPTTELTWPLPLKENGGSRIQSIRIYHSLSHAENASADAIITSRGNLRTDNQQCPSEVDWQSSFVLAETPADHSGIKFADLETGCWHRFQIAAINGLGEGPRSNWTEPLFLDVVPNPPGKPSVRKLSSCSVQVSIVPPERSGCSELTGYRITFYKIINLLGSGPGSNRSGLSINGRAGVEIRSMDRIVSAVEVFDVNQLIHTIAGLEPGTKYYFKVVARNQKGESASSERSDDVCLDDMLPRPAPLRVKITSPRSVEILMQTDLGETVPNLSGFRVIYAKDPNFILNPTVINGIKPNESSLHVDDLQYGGIYYFAQCLLGGLEESEWSVPTFVPLAAYLPLPVSPQPEPEEKNHATDDPILEPASSSGRLNKATSRSRDLKFSEKIRNLHRGFPSQTQNNAGQQQQQQQLQQHDDAEYGSKYADDGWEDEGHNNSGHRGSTERLHAGHSASTSDPSVSVSSNSKEKSSSSDALSSSGLSHHGKGARRGSADSATSGDHLHQANSSHGNDGAAGSQTSERQKTRSLQSLVDKGGNGTGNKSHIASSSTATTTTTTTTTATRSSHANIAAASATSGAVGTDPNGSSTGGPSGNVSNPGGGHVRNSLSNLRKGSQPLNSGSSTDPLSSETAQSSSTISAPGGSQPPMAQAVLTGKLGIKRDASIVRAHSQRDMSNLRHDKK